MRKDRIRTEQAEKALLAEDLREYANNKHY